MGLVSGDKIIESIRKPKKTDELVTPVAEPKAAEKKVISVDELIGKDAPQKKRVVNVSDVFDTDPVFGRSMGKKKKPAIETLKPVLQGYRNVEEFMPKDQQAAFKVIIDGKDNPDDYRARVTASMLMAESGPFDYKTIMGDFDNITKARFDKKINPGQVLDKLSPYKRMPAFEAGKEQNWFTKAWQAVTEKINGGPDIGYYESEGRFSKEASRGPFGKTVLGSRPRKDKSEFERKGAGESIKDGLSQAGVRMSKSVAGGAQIAGDAFEDFDRYDTGNPEKMTEWGRMMAQAADAYYSEHPEEAMQLQSNTGVVGTTMQFIERPEMIVQGLTEAVPMLLEAALGHITGTKAAQVIGKGATVIPWSGRVAAIGSETFGSTYSDARAAGDEPGEAFARATLTATGEGIVEEFTLGKKVAVFKGAAGKAVKRSVAMAAADKILAGPKKVVIEGAKAGGRGFLEEGTQAVNENFWRMVFTDTEPLKQDFMQRVSEGVPEAAATGMIMEPVMTGGFGAAGQATNFISDRKKVVKIRASQKAISNNPDLTDSQKAEINIALGKTERDILSGKYSDRGRAKAAEVGQKIKTAFKLDDKQAIGIESIIAGRAEAMGLTTGQFVETFIDDVTEDVQAPESISEIEAEAVDVFGQADQGGLANVEMKVVPVGKNVTKVPLKSLIKGGRLFSKYPNFDQAEVVFSNDKKGSYVSGTSARPRIHLGEGHWDVVGDLDAIAKKKSEVDAIAEATRGLDQNSPEYKKLEDEYFKQDRELNVLENTEVARRINKSGVRALEHEIEHAKQEIKGVSFSSQKGLDFEEYYGLPEEIEARNAEGKHLTLDLNTKASKKSPDVLGQAQSTEAVADDDGQPILDNIWYQNKLKGQVRSEIIEHPVYELMLDEEKQRAEMLMSHISEKLDFGENLGDVTDYIDGNTRSAKGYLWKYVSSTPGEGTPWDSLAEEYAGITNTESISDPRTMIEEIDWAHRTLEQKGKIHPRAFKKAGDAGDFSFAVAAMKYEKLTAGENADLINQRIGDMAKAFGVEQKDARELWLKSHKAYKVDIKRKKLEKRKAQVEFAEDGKAVIRAFEGADFSSAVHELAHIFRRTLDKKSLRSAERWAGVNDGKWTKQTEEMFARGYEKYLYDGKAPNEGMKKIFAQFREWMLKIYTSLASSPIDINISDDMRSVYDRMLNVREIHPGEMNYDEFFDKITREINDPDMKWHTRYGVMANETPRQSHKRLKKAFKARQAEAELSGGGGGDGDDAESNMTSEQIASVQAMVRAEIKPNSAAVASNMGLSIEELLLENDRDAVVVGEARKKLSKAYASGRDDGISRASKKFKQMLDQHKARKHLRQYVQDLGRKISKRIPSTVDLAYREMIAAIQQGVDPSFRSSSTIADRERIRRIMTENPDIQLPKKLVDVITKKALNELTITELEDLAAEREHLEKLGRKKKQLKLAQEKQRINNLTGQLVMQIQSQVKLKDKMVKPDDIDPADIDVVEVGKDGGDVLYRVTYKGQEVVDYSDDDGLQVKSFRLAPGQSVEDIKKNVSKVLLREVKAPVTSSTSKDSRPKKLWQAMRAFSLRPMRIFDMFDGGKGDFDGLMHKTFYDAVNQAWDAKLRMTDTRAEAGDEKLAELGLTLKDLAQTRTINGVQYSTQEIMGIYGYGINYKSKLALFFGNNISQKTVVDATWHCEYEDPRLGELVRWIISEFDDHFDRLDEAYISVQERGAFDDEDFAKLQEQRQDGGGIKVAGLAKEDNYLPMRRQEIDYTPDARQILNELLERSTLKKAYAEKGFTIQRSDIPAQFQKPIRLDLWSLWVNQVNTQEHFIHLGSLTADLHRIAGNNEFKESVRDAFGNDFNKQVQDYVSRVANPHIYKSYGYWANLSRTLRSNAAISYLAFNAVTMIKQLPSLLYYLPDAGIHLASSLAEFTAHPLKTIEKVRKLDPQVAHPAMERVLEELKTSDGNAYDKILRRLGKWGMKGIYAMDTVARTVGWNAVYEKALAENKSQDEAIRLAQNATLRTQPAAAGKDIASMYTQNEALNWFLMFSNQLSQMYNMTTYDAPRNFKNKQFMKAALSMSGIAVSGLLMWALSNRQLPDEPEDFADALGSQAIAMIPLAGSAINATRQGFGGGGIGAVDEIATMYQAIEDIATGVGDAKDWARLAESGGVLAGIPTVQPKRIIRTINEGDLTELIGGKRKK